MADPVVGLLGFRFLNLDGDNRDTMMKALENCPSHEFKDVQGNLPQWIANNNPVAIVATGNENIRKVQAATTTIPIIMAPATGNPNVNHIADPANVTGLTVYGPPAGSFRGSNAERIIRFKAALATLTRLAILKFRTPDTDGDLDETKNALPAGIDPNPEVWVWGTVQELQGLFNDYKRRKDNNDPTLPNGLLVMADFHHFIRSNRQIIIQRTKQLDLPAIYPSAEFVTPGDPPSFSFGPDMSDLFKDIAAYVCTVLGGQTSPPPPKWATPSAWTFQP